MPKHDIGGDGSSERGWREYAAGGGSAVVAITCTFPINKAMFRQQVYGISATKAAKQLYQEYSLGGILNLYRGLMSPLCMRFASSSVMFGSYSQYRRAFRNRFGLGDPTSKLCGAVMAGASEAVLMPFERVQVLMQERKYHGVFKNTPDAFVKLFAHGPREYYRGLSAILLRNCPGNILFFSGRERIREGLPPQFRSSPLLINLSDFLSGAVLGAFISTVFFPVNVTKTHMQLVVGGEFIRFRAEFLRLLRERGIRGMFRGVHVNYTRSFIQWGIINVTYENLLQILKSL